MNWQETAIVIAVILGIATCGAVEMHGRDAVRLECVKRGLKAKECP